MRVLITGITGFAGSHLAEYVLDHHKEWEVFGIKRWRSRLENIVHIQDKITLVEADLKDEASLVRALKIIKPNYISHLGAHSFVPTSWKMPAEVMINNAVGEVNLFEAVRQVCPEAQIQIAGSSEEYGFVKPNEIPINENNPLRPLSTYGVSKVAQDLLGYQYYKSYGMKIVRTRAFNHTGPRRGEVFVCSAFAKQVAEIEKRIKEPVIAVGNLEAVRDFTDVRDMVRGYWMALDKGVWGDVYNLGSGKCVSMAEVLDTLLKISGVPVEIVINPDQLRPSDVPILVCDSSKFNNRTGWEAHIELKQTLTDLLNYWREKLL